MDTYNIVEILKSGYKETHFFCEELQEALALIKAKKLTKSYIELWKLKSNDWIHIYDMDSEGKIIKS